MLCSSKSIVLKVILHGQVQCHGNVFKLVSEQLGSTWYPWCSAGQHRQNNSALPWTPGSFHLGLGVELGPICHFSSRAKQPRDNPVSSCPPLYGRWFQDESSCDVFLHQHLARRSKKMGYLQASLVQPFSQDLCCVQVPQAGDSTVIIHKRACKVVFNISFHFLNSDQEF